MLNLVVGRVVNDRNGAEADRNRAKPLSGRQRLPLAHMADRPVDESVHGVADTAAGDSTASDALDGDIVTVADLNGDIGTLLENTTDLRFDYVVGDVSDHGVANGHEHFDLTHDDASIHCVTFSFRRDGVSNPPEEGDRVAVAGDLSFYEPRGSCSVLVTEVVNVGEGTYEQTRREYREALESEGLFDEERKQPLPELPGRIGILTSADSDARTDAVTAIHERYPDVDITVQHATVQGENALPDLLSGLEALDRDPEVDLILIIRGGGADATLRAFDEPALCRAIAEADTPVAVGIGHENDRVLAGEVADERVMTPTHAGELVPVRADLIGDHDRLAAELDRAYRGAVDDRLAALQDNLDTAYVRGIERDIADYRTDLDTAYQRRIDRGVAELQGDLDRAYETFVRRRLDDLRSSLYRAFEGVEHEKQTEEAVEAAKEEAKVKAKAEREAELAAARRRYRLAVAALVVLLILGAAAFLLL